MFGHSTPCSETVEMLRALLLGADGACVRISPVSILALLVPFVATVALLQWFARRLVRGPGDPAPADPLRRAEPFRPRTGQVSRHLRGTADE